MIVATSIIDRYHFDAYNIIQTNQLSNPASASQHSTFSIHSNHLAIQKDGKSE